MKKIKGKYVIYNGRGEIILSNPIDIRLYDGEKIPIIEIILPEEYEGEIFKSIHISPKQLKKLI